jgi:uncharacterized membrane protein required for colicin V production
MTEMPVSLSVLVDIIITLILIFSFIGGLKEGIIKELGSLIAFIIALPLTVIFFIYVSPWFSFIGNAGWRSLLAFLLTLGIITLIIMLLFWIPKHFLDKAWSGGFIWSLLGGLVGVLNSALGLVLLVNLMDIYPVFSIFNTVLHSSGVLNWLVMTFGGFVLSLLHLFGASLQVANIFSCVA